MSDAPAQPGGSGADSGAPSGAPAGFVSQADLERAVAEAARRASQSTADTLRSQFEAQIAGLKPSPAPEPAPAAQAPTLEQFESRMRSILAQDAALSKARSDLSQEFPMARRELFDAQYQTVDEMRKAVSESHKSEESHREAVLRDVEAKHAAEIEGRYGIKVTTPQAAPTGAEGGQKKLSVADVAAMSLSEQMDLDPAVVQEVLKTGV